MLIAKRFRVLILFLCVALVTLTILSMFLAGNHVFHHCNSAKQCEVCAIIHKAKSLRRQYVIVTNLSLLVLIACMSNGFRACLKQCQKSMSLVTLKVRMNP